MSDLQVREVRLCILGFGHVVQRFCEMVRDHELRLARDQGVRFVVTAAGTGSHGSWQQADGATTSEVLTAFRSNGERFPEAERPGLDLIPASGADVLIESTPLTERGEPAISHVDAAFDAMNQRISTTDGRGLVTSETFDGQGRRTMRREAGG